MVASPGSQQVVELQSLRGLAALMVLLHHCTVYYALPDQWFELAERLFNGRAAVILFFVLSGYVLTLSILRQPITVGNTLKFYYRRAWRIYPALVFAVAIGFCYWLLFKGAPRPPVMSDWMSLAYRQTNPGMAALVTPFLGFGGQYPVAVWTISIELVGSALIPFLALALTRSKWVFWGLTVVLLGVMLLMTQRLFGSTKYLVYFAFGASIVLWGPWLAKVLADRRVAAAAAVASIAALLLIQQVPGWLAGSRSTAPDIAYLLEGIAATALVAIVAVHREAAPLFKAPALVFLGDISYGLYLLHLPVLVFVAGIGTEWLRVPGMVDNPFIATAILIVVTLATTIPLSWLTYRFIELPGIAMGRRLPTGPRFGAVKEAVK